MTSSLSRVPWAGYGPLSSLLGRALRPQNLPVLILSRGRSGSSWLGEILGKIGHALYLRKPITQSRLAQGPSGPLPDVDPAQPSAGQETFGRLAFPRLALFANQIVKQPAQLSLPQRARRWVVIKEVTPQACAWYTQRFHPLRIVLVRHPAAVRLSFRQRRWWLTETWREIGREQGRSLSQTWQGLQNYSAQCTVVYEDLYQDPVSGFRTLFDFAGLTWANALPDLIARRPTGNDRTSSWGSARDRRGMARLDQENIWRGPQSAARRLSGLRPALVSRRRTLAAGTVIDGTPNTFSRTAPSTRPA